MGECGPRPRPRGYGRDPLTLPTRFTTLFPCCWCDGRGQPPCDKVDTPFLTTSQEGAPRDLDLGPWWAALQVPARSSFSWSPGHPGEAGSRPKGGVMGPCSLRRSLCSRRPPPSLPHPAQGGLIAPVPSLHSWTQRGVLQGWGALPFSPLGGGPHLLPPPPPPPTRPHARLHTKAQQTHSRPSLDLPPDRGLGTGGGRLYLIPWNVHYSRSERPSSFSSDPASLLLPPLL